MLHADQGRLDELAAAAKLNTCSLLPCQMLIWPGFWLASEKLLMRRVTILSEVLHSWTNMLVVAQLNPLHNE